MRLGHFKIKKKSRKKKLEMLTVTQTGKGKVKICFSSSFFFFSLCNFFFIRFCIYYIELDLVLGTSVRTYTYASVSWSGYIRILWSDRWVLGVHIAPRIPLCCLNVNLEASWFLIRKINSFSVNTHGVVKVVKDLKTKRLYKTPFPLNENFSLVAEKKIGIICVGQVKVFS